MAEQRFLIDATLALVLLLYWLPLLGAA